MPSTQGDHRQENGATPRGVARIVPVTAWLPRYKPRWLPLDVVAGITVWALIVPEAMAYAAIAGVPVQYGLFAVPLALLGYAVFGTCRELFVGPSATIASLSAAAVAPLVAVGSDASGYVALTAVLALTVGVLYVVGGLARLGFIAHFFARPVLDGFIIGLGIFIAAGQLPKLVGIPKPSGDTLAIVVRTFAEVGSWAGPTLAVGVAALVLLFGIKRLLPRLPAAVVVVALSILAVNLFDLTDHGVAVVGDVPTGFDFVSYSSVSWGDVLDLLPGALAIALVGFAQSIAIVKSYAVEHDRAVDANQEMLAYGAANLGSGLLQGFAVTGSLSKSAAAQEARARSQVAPLVSAVMVVLTVLFLAGLFRDLPEAVLAAVVIEAVSGMVRVGKLTALRRGRTPEFFAAIGALLVGIFPGVVIGVALSFALLIHTLDHPHVARIGRSPDGTAFADREDHPEFESVDRVLVERFESPLIFANADLFIGEMKCRVREADGPIDALVLDFEAVSQVDMTGSDALLRLRDALARDGVCLVLARINASVRRSLDRTGVLAAVGTESVLPTVRDAVAHAVTQVRDGSARTGGTRS